MDTIIINGQTYVKQTEVSPDNWVLIRTESAGVHFGQLDSKTGQAVVLTNTRRIWYWEGAASLSQMALEGVKKPEKCKFSVVLPKICLLQAIEIIPCTVDAVRSINDVPVWKV